MSRDFGVDESDVQECLSHLHDAFFLEAHRLREFLSPPDASLSGARVRQVLLETIEQLKPIGSEPESPESVTWRRYRYLWLRYEEGLPHHDVAAKLHVSERQASRDKQGAMCAFMSLLRARCGQLPAPGGALVDATTVDPPVVTTLAPGAPALQSELVQLASAPLDRSTELREVVTGVIATIAPLAAERQVALEAVLTDSLSPVAMRRTLLRQALFNLLGYAIEREPGTRILVAAADTAHGVELSLDIRRRKGRPPRWAVEGRNGADAASLLAAGRELLESQGGTVEVNEHGDGGTSIDLVLPPVQLPTILVVDDNPDVVGLFRRYLRRDHYRLVHAGSGRNVVKVANELHPDLITLDLMMPSQDGWEILQQLRALEATRSTPVIVCSVLPEKSLARSLGVTEFLPKPVSPDALRSALDRCLKTRV